MPKLALIQMHVVGGAKRENLRHARDLILQAASAGAQIVVLPEAMTLGWTHPLARTEADSLPDGASIVALREAAMEAGVHVCSGFIERAGEKIFNSAVLIAPGGSILLHHRKLNELELAHDLYALGDRLQVVETPFGRIGLMICADGFARGQVIARALGYMGAEIILSPSAWAVPSDHDNVKEPYGQLWMDNYSPVARDFGLWIVGVSNVGWLNAGPWSGRKCIGCSLVVGPSGEKVMQGPYGVDAEAVLTIEFATLPRLAQGDGWAHLWQR